MSNLIPIGPHVKLRQGLAINRGSAHLVSDKKDEEFCVPLLRIADMMDGTFSTYISKYAPSNVFAKKGDIVYTRTGQIGLVFNQYEGCVHNNSFVVELQDDVFDKDYLIVALKSSFVRDQALNKAMSSVQPDLTHDMFKDILIPFFKKDIQKKIAKQYNSIDEKIKNNSKIITELESMAKTLYDYWFLQFEFPNENGKPYKSSGGKMVYNEELKREIPEGWEVEKLGNVCDLLLGGTPSRKNENFWNGNINWLNSGEISDFPIVKTEEKITDDGLSNSATKLMKKGTVVISITGNIRTSILGIDSCANQSVVGIEENLIFKKEYLYPLLSMLIRTYTNISTGNCQQHINKQTLEESYVLIPESSILNSYYSKTSCNYDMIITKAIENKELASLRDFLLPMLMNGQVTFK